MKLTAFEKLGEEVERRWRDANMDEAAFARICVSALEDFRLPERESVWDSVPFALSLTKLPAQQDLPGRFGQPPITVWESNRFHIDIYFWLTGTTSIHQHGFSGAFQVFLGSSVHGTFDFSVNEHINRAMEVGDIGLRHVELLKVGDIREIRSGRQFIHSLFHLDHPSATIVIRTNHVTLDAPQYDYRRPFLAIDPFFQDPNLAKQLQMVTLLYRVRRPDADDQVADFLSRLDFPSTLNVLSHVRPLLAGDALERHMQLDRSVDRFGRFMDVARRRHGALIDVLPPVFSHLDVTDELTRRRAFVTNPDLRFFIALLMNVSGRDRILDLVRARVPGADPTDQVLDWVGELGRSRLVNSYIPTALGVANFTDTDVDVIERLMRGQPLAPDGHDDAALRARAAVLSENVIIKSLLS